MTLASAGHWGRSIFGPNGELVSEMRKLYGPECGSQKDPGAGRESQPSGVAREPVYNGPRRRRGTPQKGPNIFRKLGTPGCRKVRGRRRKCALSMPPPMAAPEACG